MRRTVRFLASLAACAAVAGPAWARNEPPPVDPKDKLVSETATGAVSDWQGEPWWMALADCSSAWRLDPPDKAKTSLFGVAAGKRISADRGIEPKAAMADVVPYIAAGQGAERAQTHSAIWGGPDELRKRCEGVMVQYKAAFP